MASVSIQNVEKFYDSYHAVRGITLEIPDHAFVVLVGPSGCGKSTMLRMIAGLEEISNGELRIGDKVVNRIPPGKRDIAMVFQNYALYPHMTVYENIAFGLKQRKTPKEEVQKRIDDVAHMLGISQLMHRRPRELSGGQRQRVAMGRAMVRKPSLFLFDEPLSNLDAKLRMHMRTEIKRLHQTMPTSTIYVTHDQVEAMTLADIVVVMNEGRIEQYGAPQHIYQYPQSRFVASFIGSPAMNFFDAMIVKQGSGLVLLLADGTSLALPVAEQNLYHNWMQRPVTLGLRPEHCSLIPSEENAASLRITIDILEPLGPEVLLYWKWQKNSFCTRLPPGFTGTPGQTLTLYPDMSKVHLFDSTTGRRISES